MAEPPSFCPVPEEQQPLNEFRELQESWFFRWALLPWGAFVRLLLFLWGVSSLIAGPIAAASFAPAKLPLQFALMMGAGAIVLPFLALLRLYLGWRYVRSRLDEPRVFYEESGWYDGQYWTKTEESLQQDRLVVTYEVNPLLRRLERTFGAIGLLILLGVVGWQLL